MNRNDDFDKVLESWLHRQAPSQAPDRVLDAALDRVAAQSQRRSWLQRFLGGTQMATFTRVAAVSAVIAIAVLIGLQFSNLTNNVGTSPSPIPSASAEPSASVESSEPSPGPSEAALLLRLMGGGEAGPVHLVTILDDGRVITTDPFGGSPPMERRLAAAGIQLVREELDATGLTDTSADYMPVPNPGAEPPGYGGAGPRLEVAQPGGDTVVINWFLFGDTEQDYFQPQPEAEALEALAARIVTLDEWLPTSAWADADARPHAPEFYRIFMNVEEWGGSPDDLPVESSTVAWPLDGTIEGFGDPLEGAPEGMAIRCGMVSSEDGTAVIEALEAAGAAPGNQSYALGDRATSRLLTVTVEPILPLDEPTCEGAFPF